MIDDEKIIEMFFERSEQGINTNGISVYARHSLCPENAFDFAA